MHVFAWQLKHLHLDRFKGRVEYAQLLNDASEIKTVDLTARVQSSAVYQKEATRSAAETLTLELRI